MSIAEESLLKIREKLLDLSQRNRLLSFRETTQSLRIVDELPRQVFEVLVNDQNQMAFEPLPEDEDEENEEKRNELPFPQNFRRPTLLPTPPNSPTLIAELPKVADQHSNKHSDRLLQTNLGPLKLETRCRRIIQSSRVAIEEMGTNILFLTMGFLEWYQPEEPEKKYLAPLILIPVAIERGRLSRSTNSYQYLISYTGEDLEINLCLREKLARDFDLILPELPEENDVEAYFASVAEMAKRKKNWRVAREMLLGMFSFSKLLMYKDLGADSWPEDKPIANHEKLKDLLEGRKLQPSSIGGSECYSEEILEKAKLPLVMDADSSQHTALVDILSGRDQVIIGPPGTGKSQTITNLIAAAIGQGKSVLFVSEKLAALEVVRRRMEQVGLGVFCLELHSWKTQKRKLLEDLERRLKYRCDGPKSIQEAVQAYESAKEPLNSYVALVNAVASGTGETIQQVLWSAERWRSESTDQDPAFPIANAIAFTRKDVTARENILYDISTHLATAPLRLDNPWRGFRPTRLLAGEETHISALLESGGSALESLQRGLDAFQDESGIKTEFSLQDVLTFDGVALGRIQTVPAPFYEDFVKTCITSDVKPTIEALARQIDVYQATIRNAGELLSPNMSAGDLGDLVEQAERLRLEGLASHSLNDLRAIQEACREANHALSGLASVANHLQQLGFEKIATVQQLNDRWATVMYIVQVPSAVESAVCKSHILPDAPNIFELSYSAFRQLEVEFAKHSPIIDFAKCPSSDELIRLATIIRDKHGRLLSVFSSELRRARAEIRSFLKIQAIAKSATISDRLIEVAELNRRVETACTDVLTRNKLGSLFNGMRTDWKMMASTIEWVQELRKTLGSDQFAERVILSLPSFKGSLLKLMSDGERAIERYRNALETCARVRVIDSAIAFSGKQLAEQSEYFERLDRLFTDSLPILERAATSKSHCPVEMKRSATCLQNGEALAKELLANSEFADAFRSQFKGVDTNLVHCRKLQSWVAQFHQASIPSAFKAWVLKQDIADRVAKVINVFVNVLEGAGKTRSMIHGMSKSGEFQLVAYFGGELSKVNLPNAIARMKMCSLGSIDLMAWADYCRLAEKASELQLAEVLSSLERGSIKAERLREIFIRSYYESMAKHIVKAHPELTHFSRASHERIRKQYAELDVNLMRVFQKQIAYDVSRRQVPYGNSHGYVKDYTERALIEHELSKKKKHIPIRQLVKKAAHALKALKPCFMMSPLSVALYLEPAGIEFDLVVMDEASQLRPEDALGAVARGKQIVVVGDTKQLPPTTFFEKVIDGDETEEEEKETATDFAESILDVCLKTYQPSRQLQWHYRSQHESLIAFSNRQFYESDLIVFPSPRGNLSGLGVSSHYLEGAKYSKGRNPLEADAVSAAVVQHVLKYPKISLGVGTFNAEQRDLILDSLDRRLKENTAAQRVIDEMQEGNEPFFVKNLENIQGDERDVIFISTTYGPDAETGIAHQRFGPIAGPTGWRRLNVMFTRAKKRVEVFTSLRPHDIKLTPQSSRGAVALKAYLEYAESGRFSEQGQATDRGPESDFEISVARVVESLGFKVVPQVGVAGFFIDIGVVHPSSTGEFLLGIECDGATYHAARSARDRDRLRQEILERLNWKLYRIWSTEWFKNRDSEIRRLRERLQGLNSSAQTSV